jgi:hypothetical protein
MTSVEIVKLQFIENPIPVPNNPMKAVLRIRDAIHRLSHLGVTTGATH